MNACGIGESAGRAPEGALPASFDVYQEPPSVYVLLPSLIDGFELPGPTVEVVPLAAVRVAGNRAQQCELAGPRGVELEELGARGDALCGTLGCRALEYALDGGLRLLRLRDAPSRPRCAGSAAPGS